MGLPRRFLFAIIIVVTFILSADHSSIITFTSTSPSTQNKHSSLPSPQNTAGNITDNASSSIYPKWEIREDVKPYMGNLTCPFEVAHWNLESFYNPTDLVKRRDCGKLQYMPYDGYTAPNVSAIFNKVVNGSTIYFIGDSMTCQTGADFLCLMASISKITKKDIQRLPPKNWCNGANECEVNFNGFTGWMSASATFTSMNRYIRVIVDIEYGRVGKLREHLNNAKKGDIYVLNQGLHKRRDKGYDFLLNTFKESKGSLVSAKEKGATLLWRETTAAHFHTIDGYYDSSVPPLQAKKAAVCVRPLNNFDRDKSRSWDDTGIGPFMNTLGIPILKVWESSFLAPEYCHIGQGMDCVHWLQPGPTSYLSQAVVDYILNIDE